MPAKDITTNIIALTGSWGMTFIAGVMQNVGVEVPAIAGDADLLMGFSGFAASFMTIALGVKRILEGMANNKLIMADARKSNAEAKAIELSNKREELQLIKDGLITS